MWENEDLDVVFFPFGGIRQTISPLARYRVFYAAISWHACFHRQVRDATPGCHGENGNRDRVVVPQCCGKLVHNAIQDRLQMAEGLGKDEERKQQHSNRRRTAEDNRLFAALTERQLRRNSFRSTIQLEQAIREFLAEHNSQPKPFVWTKTADQILESIARYCRRINDSAH